MYAAALSSVPSFTLNVKDARSFPNCPATGRYTSSPPSSCAFVTTCGDSALAEVIVLPSSTSCPRPAPGNDVTFTLASVSPFASL